MKCVFSKVRVSFNTSNGLNKILFNLTSIIFQKNIFKDFDSLDINKAPGPYYINTCELKIGKYVIASHVQLTVNECINSNFSHIAKTRTYYTSS